MRSVLIDVAIMVRVMTLSGATLPSGGQHGIYNAQPFRFLMRMRIWSISRFAFGSRGEGSHMNQAVIVSPLICPPFFEMENRFIRHWAVSLALRVISIYAMPVALKPGDSCPLLLWNASRTDDGHCAVDAHSFFPLRPWLKGEASETIMGSDGKQSW